MSFNKAFRNFLCIILSILPLYLVGASESSHCINKEGKIDFKCRCKRKKTCFKHKFSIPQSYQSDHLRNTISLLKDVMKAQKDISQGKRTEKKGPMLFKNKISKLQEEHLLLNQLLNHRQRIKRKKQFNLKKEIKRQDNLLRKKIKKAINKLPEKKKQRLRTILSLKPEKNKGVEKLMLAKREKVKRGVSSLKKFLSDFSPSWWKKRKKNKVASHFDKNYPIERQRARKRGNEIFKQNLGYIDDDSEYEIDNDINLNKENSLWKIISNRYLKTFQR